MKRRAKVSTYLIVNYFFFRYFGEFGAGVRIDLNLVIVARVNTVLFITLPIGTICAECISIM